MEEFDLRKMKETADVEFKEAASRIPLSFYETYSAFANTRGGTVFLGVSESEDGSPVVVGVENASQKRKQLFDALSNKSKVSACLCLEDDIQILDYGEKKIIRVEIPEAPTDDKPVFINGDVSQSYRRLDSGDHLLPKERIESMLNDKTNERFDQKPNRLGIKIGDLDQESLSQFINEVKASGRLRANSTIDEEALLMRVGAYHRDEKTGEYVLNNGAVMFLGKTVDVLTICPNLWLCYEKLGESSLRWLDRVTSKDLDWEGNIFQFYRRALAKSIEYSPAPFRLSGARDVGGANVTAMLREAFANAIGNLDLFDALGVRIEDSGTQIVFANAGTMLLPLERALLGGVSKPRNPTLFSFFQALGIADRGGYGIPFLFEAAKDLGFSEPHLEESEEENRMILTIFYRQTKKNELTPAERKMLGVFKREGGFLTAFEAIDRSGLSRDKGRRVIDVLCSLGLIESNGKSTKGKAYRFVRDA